MSSGGYYCCKTNNDDHHNYDINGLHYKNDHHTDDTNVHHHNDDTMYYHHNDGINHNDNDDKNDEVVNYANGKKKNNLIRAQRALGINRPKAAQIPSCFKPDNDVEMVSLTMCLFYLLVKLLRDPIEVW